MFGCENYSVKGSGKTIELDLKEVKAFMDDKNTGFLYVKSAISSATESDRRNLEAIESVAKEQSVDFYVFDEKKHQKYIQDFGVDQYSEQLAFYQDGKQMSILDFGDISKDDILSKNRLKILSIQCRLVYCDDYVGYYDFHVADNRY